MAKSRKYWLFKSEPDVYSIQDLVNESDQVTMWEGVRNYQVRNMLREDAVTAEMTVLAKGSRLSITPVTAAEWKAVHKLAGVKPA